MHSDSEKNLTLPATTTPAALEGTPSNDSYVADVSLPKLVVCFDINTLSVQELQTIASDLKVPNYNQMSKEQLCETLLAL